MELNTASSQFVVLYCIARYDGFSFDSFVIGILWFVISSLASILRISILWQALLPSLFYFRPLFQRFSSEGKNYKQKEGGGTRKQ